MQYSRAPDPLPDCQALVICTGFTSTPRRYCNYEQKPRELIYLRSEVGGGGGAFPLPIQ